MPDRMERGQPSLLANRIRPTGSLYQCRRRIGLPYAARDVFVDDDAGADAATVARRLKQVERIARRTGAAIAIGHPRDATLSALEDWLPTLAGRGFALVPVSTIVARRDVPG